MYVDLIGAYQQRRGRKLPESVKAQNERLQKQVQAPPKASVERLERERERRHAKELAKRRERYHSAKQREQKAAQQQEAVQRERERRLTEAVEFERSQSVLAAMPGDERISYELEGALPLTLIAGATDEDLDPTPVPQGCPSCWRTSLYGGGELCIRCPDPTAHARRRQERQQD